MIVYKSLSYSPKKREELKVHSYKNNAMFVLLVVSSDTLGTIQDIIGLSNSLSEKGNKVVIFFNEESVNLLKKGREELTVLSVGTRLKACRTTASRKGLNNRDDLIIGSEMSSLGELVDLMEEADRTVFL